MLQTISKIIAINLVFIMTIVSAMVPTAKASIIETEVVFNQERGIELAYLQDVLAREDVRKELLALGVDPAYADERVAALTPDEIIQLQNKIESLPAGASALAVLGALFLVLLVLEVVGVTNIFSKL